MAKKTSKKNFDQFGISKARFAELIGVSRTSVYRYFHGELKGIELIKKIEIGCEVLCEMDTVWPVLVYIPGSEKHIKEYEKNKKKAEKLDKKFLTAYKKALKKAGL